MGIVCSLFTTHYRYWIHDFGQFLFQMLCFPFQSITFRPKQMTASGLMKCYVPLLICHSKHELSCQLEIGNWTKQNIYRSRGLVWNDFHQSSRNCCRNWIFAGKGIKLKPYLIQYLFILRFVALRMYYLHLSSVSVKCRVVWKQVCCKSNVRKNRQNQVERFFVL